jgi:hypothetical protein
LQARRYEVSSALFAISALTKWQPLIVLPFVAIYHLVGERDELAVKRAGLRIWPGILVCLAVVAEYGWGPLYSAFEAATHQQFLSGDALNFNWLLTFYLERVHPEWLGGLHGKLTWLIWTNDARLLVVQKVFYVFYGLTLGLFALRKRTFNELLLYSACGFMCYFTFNTGTHENHLVIAAVLLFLLALHDASFRMHAAFVGVILNINLLLFVGYSGETTPGFDRAAMGLDITVPFAVLHTIYFFVFWTVCMLPGANRDVGIFALNLRDGFGRMKKFVALNCLREGADKKDG